MKGNKRALSVIEFVESSHAIGSVATCVDISEPDYVECDKDTTRMSVKDNEIALYIFIFI